MGSWKVAKRPFDLLSFGVLVIILASCLTLSAGGLIVLVEVPSLVIALSGVWIIALAGLRMNRQEKYGRSAFSTFSWGVIISALGLVWFLLNREILVTYLPAVFLFVVGVLAIAATLRYWKK
jgi:hypothetical protein